VELERTELQEIAQSRLINSPLVHDNSDVQRRAKPIPGSVHFKELCVAKYNLENDNQKKRVEAS
jgi:hypothetical protein